MFSLSQIRSFFGFTQAQAGDYLMIPQSLVADFEKGIRPIPVKSIEALNVLSTLLEEMESIELSHYSALFETDAASEIRYWRKIAENAEEAADDLEKELEKLNQSRLQVARVYAFTEKVAEKPDSPLGLRRPGGGCRKINSPSKSRKHPKAFVSDSVIKFICFGKKPGRRRRIYCFGRGDKDLSRIKEPRSKKRFFAESHRVNIISAVLFVFPHFLLLQKSDTIKTEPKLSVPDRICPTDTRRFTYHCPFLYGLQKSIFPFVRFILLPAKASVYICSRKISRSHEEFF